MNPAARGARAHALEDRLRLLAPEAEVALTRGPGHAEDLARAAAGQGFDAVVAAGGDGTVNEVVNGLDPARCALGVLPLGTVNVLAREIGMPADLSLSVDVIRRGTTALLDVGSANGRRFLQLAGVGLDAEAVKQTVPGMKRVLGPLGYLLTAARLSLGSVPELRVRAHGEEHRGKIVLVGNGRYYGGAFRVFPQADMADGLLDAWVLRGSGPLDVLRYFRAVVADTTSGLRDAIYLRAPQLTVESGERVALEVDGELCGHSPVEFSVEPRSLRVIIP